MNTAFSYLNLRRGLILLAAIFVLLALWILLVPHAAASKELHIGSRVLQVELATTSAQQTLGLGGRPSMPADHGMLFVFQSRGLYPFWMKGMEFPLDIVWIDHGTVTEVVTLDPPTSTQALPQEYEPTLPADRVLEINAGQAKKLGIAPGTALQLP